MAFHVPAALYPDVMVCAIREGVSKNGRNYLSMSISDTNGATNDVSTSDEATIAYCKTLKQGDRIDLWLMLHADQKRSYMMIANVEHNVTLREPRA